MDTSILRAILLGRDFPSSPQSSVRVLSKQVAVGISPGHTDHNEDAVGAVVLGDRTILAVADGHWGDGASVLATSETIHLLEKAGRPQGRDGNEINGWFYAMFERINRTLLDKALQGDIVSTPETSLIVAQIAPHKEGSSIVHWASFGDAFLYLCSSDGTAKQLNTLRSMWLGALSALAGRSTNGRIVIPYPNPDFQDEYRGVADGLEVNQVTLNAGDTLILATDGLPQCEKYNVTTLYPSDIQRIVSSLATAESKCRALIQAALERGGVDNIACAVYYQTA